jgi:transposase InsO family protein
MLWRVHLARREAAGEATATSGACKSDHEPCGVINAGQLTLLRIDCWIGWSVGRGLRLFTLLDVVTRECVALEAGLGLSGQSAKRVLTLVVEECGERPDAIGVDNGPEFVSHTLTQWCKHKQIKLR